ncbi:hypothetical protein RSSM_02745 [Rhodopirellula sallentina SM41]|uniref:Uncharacterized protein n=1 Tax=Rhodopirellula sallentina SM41 TaxID=1263870 RepID=M5UD93_9BACT|nr:hypothetical protein RSSM_02745 [Rhodopirellula sallentina SM41]
MPMSNAGTQGTRPPLHRNVIRPSQCQQSMRTGAAIRYDSASAEYLKQAQRIQRKRIRR